ncbi:MAG TPA: hypothetical protein PL009_03710 [Flavipsychrobacter sp.]|nr:hypothetical protein [Flavipsychrobacter sp.]
MKVLIMAAVAVLAGEVASVRGQTYMETFGQNRIQTRKYDWRFFDTEHFRIYHYDAAGRQLARYVAEQAEKDIKIVERKMGGKFPNRFNIILYNNYDHYRQTNIGRKYDSQLQNVPAGTVNLVGDKLVVYFTGVHTDVRRQLRSGMSRVVMQRLLFGESFREMVKNAVLLNLPQWTTDGFIAYLVDGWDAKTETDWKNLLQAQSKPDFYHLAEKEPELAGKAFWKFISESYGEGTVKNLLYNMQLKSSLPQGLKLTLGLKVKDAYDSVINFYNMVYEKDAIVQEHPDSNANKSIIDIPVPKHPREIRNIKVGPRGNDVAYVEWKEGQFKVVIQNTQHEERKSIIIFGGSHDYNEPPDPDYPLLAWSNNGYKLAVLYRQGRKTRLRIYNSLNAKLEDYIVPHNRFDRVLGMSFMEDDTKMVFSAVKKSQTDLYEFTIKRARITPITSDAWDDMQPWFVSGGSRRGILFLSNRPVPNLNVPIAMNELPTGPMNLFFYDTKTKRKELLQASFITKGTITQPIQYGSDHFAFLNDMNGINNKYVVLFGRDKNNMDSAYAVPVTNYSQSIISHQYNPASNQVADVVQVGDAYKVYFKPLEIPGINATEKNLQPTSLSVANEINIAPVTDNENTVIEFEKPRETILETGNVFQSEFAEDENKRKSEVPTESEIAIADTSEPEASLVTSDPYPASDIDSIFVDSTYIKLRAQPYRLSFKPDFFTVRVDNSILFNKYQPAGALGGLPPNQNLSGLITVTLDDAMEDHRFTGGFKLPINLSGTTYFLQYENFKRRVDWGILFLRDVNYYSYGIEGTDLGPYVGKLASNLLQGHISYPLDRIRSFKLYLAFRQDKQDFKAVDTIALKYLEGSRQYWTMSRAEYVFDNTINPTLNIFKGLRYKIYGEYFYRLSAPNGGFYNIGLDVRHYQPIFKNIVFASRLAYAHSGGNQQINYLMGGVDNWLFAKQSTMPPPTSQNFAFQALANNLRGYPQNARRGNTFGVINAELRAPVLTSILKRPIQSAVLKNLQLIAFADAGSAWNGWIPNSNSEDYRFTTGGIPQISISLPSPDYGIAVGYGGGIRTMLFGYFMRLDAAWNIEQQTSKPMWIFSLGTDF